MDFEKSVYIGEIPLFKDKLNKLQNDGQIVANKCQSIANFCFAISLKNAEKVDRQVGINFKVTQYEKFEGLVREARKKVEEVREALLQLETLEFAFAFIDE